MTLFIWHWLCMGGAMDWLRSCDPGLFDRGQPLQQLPALGQETPLLLVGQVLRAVGIQGDMGDP